MASVDRYGPGRAHIARSAAAHAIGRRCSRAAARAGVRAGGGRLPRRRAISRRADPTTARDVCGRSRPATTRTRRSSPHTRSAPRGLDMSATVTVTDEPTATGRVLGAHPPGQAPSLVAQPSSNRRVPLWVARFTVTSAGGKRSRFPVDRSRSSKPEKGRPSSRSCARTSPRSTKSPTCCALSAQWPSSLPCWTDPR